MSGYQIARQRQHTTLADPIGLGDQNIVIVARACTGIIELDM